MSTIESSIMCPTSSATTKAVAAATSSPNKMKDDASIHNNDEEYDDEDDDDKAPPPAKFHVKQLVYAKDNSTGLFYDAVIRRAVFGPHFHQQVQIGLEAATEEEAQLAMAAKERDSWHYFVHYNKWNVTWDRWVSEPDILEDSDASKRKADRYTQEHKRLLKELKHGKKGGGGAEFLKQWRQRMEEIDKEMESGAANDSNKNNKDDNKEANAKKEEKKPSPTKPKRKPPKKKDPWDNKANIEREFQLRLQDLQGDHNHQKKSQNHLVIPFSLKKVLVEAWEIISQCNMVPHLPAKPTVREALQQYLDSKLALLDTTPEKANENDNGEDQQANKTSKGGNTNSKSPSQPEPKTDSDDVNKEDETAISEQQKQKQEWIDMMDGIAMFFDEALPFRLLYRRELPQYRIVESTFVLPIEAEANGCAATKTAEKEETKTDEDSNKQGESGSPGGKDSSQDVVMESVGEVATSLAAVSEKSPMKVEIAVAEGGNESPSKDSTAVSAPSPAQFGGSPAASESTTDKAIITPSTSGESNNSITTGTTTATAGTTTATAATKNKNTRPMLPSEVYGCEHLLRLCLHLPELLADHQQREKERLASLGEAEAAALQRDNIQQDAEKKVRQILAKVNDLIRFLHKHQSVMFADTYRKLSPAEQKEEMKFIRLVERKRKRSMLASRPQEGGSAEQPEDVSSQPSAKKKK